AQDPGRRRWGGRVVRGARDGVGASRQQHTPLLERYYRSHRSTLFALLEVLELESTSTDQRMLAAVAVLRANRGRIGEYVSDQHEGQPIEISFAGELWRETLRARSRAGRLPRRHFEVCVFAHLAAELRTGDIAVIGAASECRQVIRPRRSSPALAP
ncbi:MAG: hypothetical protein ACRDRY_24765, partial [Pseudonocardiaceae bacterium]